MKWGNIRKIPLLGIRTRVGKRGEKELGITSGNSNPEEKLNHVTLDGDEGNRITKRAKETNDTKSKKGMKNKKEMSVK